MLKKMLFCFYFLQVKNDLNHFLAVCVTQSSFNQLCNAQLCVPTLVEKAKMFIFDIHDYQYLNSSAKNAFAISLIPKCCVMLLFLHHCITAHK